MIQKWMLRPSSFFQDAVFPAGNGACTSPNSTYGGGMSPSSSNLRLSRAASGIAIITATVYVSGCEEITACVTGAGGAAGACNGAGKK
jgi:hypothetical protein